jgi:putative phosphoribosyl transferase
MIFQDRREAGERLGRALGSLRLERPVVLGIPRGGVSVAAGVARALGGELGVIVARKVGAPGCAELAIGAVTADGSAFVNKPLAAQTGADRAYLEAELGRAVAEARRREDAFDHRRRPAIAGRPVVVVDDGVATGATALAAVRAVKRAGASRVVLAAPVGAPRTLDLLRREADDVFCLAEDPGFAAVGQFYVDFGQVDDDEVKAILDAFGPAPADPEARAAPRRPPAAEA